MLMPASNDAKKDREIFLKVLTMDDYCSGPMKSQAAAYLTLGS